MAIFDFQHVNEQHKHPFFVFFSEAQPAYDQQLTRQFWLTANTFGPGAATYQPVWV